MKCFVTDLEIGMQMLAPVITGPDFKSLDLKLKRLIGEKTLSPVCCAFFARNDRKLPST